jgi:hypothetical protein
MTFLGEALLKLSVKPLKESGITVKEMMSINNNENQLKFWYRTMAGHIYTRIKKKNNVLCNSACLY